MVLFWLGIVILNVGAGECCAHHHYYWVERKGMFASATEDLLFCVYCMVNSALWPTNRAKSGLSRLCGGDFEVQTMRSEFRGSCEQHMTAELFYNELSLDWSYTNGCCNRVLLIRLQRDVTVSRALVGEDTGGDRAHRISCGKNQMPVSSELLGTTSVELN